MTELQVAIDLLSTDAALELAAAVAPHVDIIELGTPLIKSEGLAVIRAIKGAHPDKTVFADLKTADAGALEAQIAFDAGADLVTVLGSADDSTIVGAVGVAKEKGKGIVVDLIGVEDKASPAAQTKVCPSSSGSAAIRAAARSEPAERCSQCSRSPARSTVARSRVASSTRTKTSSAASSGASSIHRSIAGRPVSSAPTT